MPAFVLNKNTSYLSWAEYNKARLAGKTEQERINAWLKSQGAHQGLRDFEAVDALARQAGLVLLEDRAMPSNNRCLVWRSA